VVAALAIAGGIAAAIATSVGGGSSPPHVAPPAQIPQVQPGANAEAGARKLAAWLQRYSR
jgi:hypothetical protein